MKFCKVVEHAFECGNWEESPIDGEFCLHGEDFDVFEDKLECMHREGFRPHLLPPCLRDYFKNKRAVEMAECLLASGEFSLGKRIKW